MPIADYLCSNKKCEKITEQFLSILPKEIECPECGQKAFKLPPYTNFVLGKGAWEKNNYNG